LKCQMLRTCYRNDRHHNHVARYEIGEPQCERSTVALSCPHSCRVMNIVSILSTRSRDNGDVHGFLVDHSFHWVEGMSLMGKLLEAMEALASLESMIDVSSINHIIPAILRRRNP